MRIQSIKIAKKLLGFAIFIIGVFLFSLSIYQIPFIKNKIPWPNNQIQAYKYKQMAKKLPPNDIKAKRLRAMAEALKKGQTDYQFETGPLPPMGSK